MNIVSICSVAPVHSHGACLSGKACKSASQSRLTWRENDEFFEAEYHLCYAYVYVFTIVARVPDSAIRPL